jgi:hypothetical protein
MDLKEIQALHTLAVPGNKRSISIVLWAMIKA